MLKSMVTFTENFWYISLNKLFLNFNFPSKMRIYPYNTSIFHSHIHCRERICILVSIMEGNEVEHQFHVTGSERTWGIFIPPFHLPLFLWRTRDCRYSGRPRAEEELHMLCLMLKKGFSLLQGLCRHKQF